MKNVPALIVIIITVVVLMIIIGFVIANLAHRYAVNTAKEKVMQTKEKIPDETTEEFTVYEEYFALQVMASSNYNKIEHLKTKLENAGYKTEITKVKREGEILYRLRLFELFLEKEAIALGDKLKDTYTEIDSYWLEERKTEIAEKNKTQNTSPKEKTEAVESDEGTDKKYEIQFLASDNYSKINNIKNALQSRGYNAKIVTTKRDNVNFYRLRLDGFYSKRQAIALGTAIKTDSPLIENFWLDEKRTGEDIQEPEIEEPAKKVRITSNGDYEIQIMANQSRSVVAKRKRQLDNNDFPAKVTSTNKNGKTYYRLRLVDSYSRTNAKKVGEQLKSRFGFITGYWIAKKTQSNPPKTRSTKKVEQTKPEKEVLKTKTEVHPIEVESLNKNGKVNNEPMTCTEDNVVIRIGPGSYYAVDPIGKLMKGITVFVIERKSGWAKFTITEDDDSWSGWVNQKYLK